MRIDVLDAPNTCCCAPTHVRACAGIARSLVPTESQPTCLEKSDPNKLVCTPRLQRWTPSKLSPLSSTVT